MSWPKLRLEVLRRSGVRRVSRPRAPSLPHAIGLIVFGLGFGVVGQVLTVAVQNDVDRRQLSVAMAATSFFRGLGGAIGAAVLGAVFAAHAGMTGGDVAMLDRAGRTDVIEAAQTVYLVAAPIAALALLIVLFLEQRPLQAAQPARAPAAPADRASAPAPAAS